jgi:hypothetical protein
MEAEQKASRVGGHERDIDMQQLAEDPELERLHADRIAQLQREAERRAELSRKGHGEYQDVSEGDFLEVGCRLRGRLLVQAAGHVQAAGCRLLLGMCRLQC